MKDVTEPRIACQQQSRYRAQHEIGEPDPLHRSFLGIAFRTSGNHDVRKLSAELNRDHASPREHMSSDQRFCQVGEEQGRRGNAGFIVEGTFLG